MSLSLLETLLVEYVADAITTARNGVAPERVLRYHGRALPEYCCSEDGALSITTMREFPSTQFPMPAGARPGKLVGVRRVAELHLRWVKCWPEIEIADGAVVLHDDEWDALAAELAEVGDAGSRALIAVSCGAEGSAEILEQSGCSAFQFIDATPTGPGGTCAGWLWRAFAGVSLRSGVSP